MSPFGYVFALSCVIALCTGYPQRALSNVNPEEIGGFFEGDLDLGPDQLIQARNGLITKARRWPGRLVVFKISPDFSAAHRAQILKAVQILESATCLTFKEADETNQYYINITANAEGCSSTVGYRQTVQRMNLQIFPINEGCFRIGSILHEFLHTLGFYHQQSASDRDDYITVVQENIIDGLESNFAKQSGTENFGIAYDYKSVLHYSEVAFSKNGEKTIITKDSSAVIGQRTGLSTKDIEKVNTMYLCPMQV